MPNHVRNKVKMTGIANLPLFTTKTDEYTKEQFTFFDFNKLIPMPESLNIESGSSEDVAIEAVLRKMSKRRFGFLSNKYGKMTDDEYERRKKAHGKTDEELAKIGLQYISNKVLYGHTTWYDWSCENWGTKWNSYDNEQVDADTILFSTAWSNPEPIMLKLSEMYPEATIEHWWADEDMGSNDGRRVYRGGKIVEGDYCDTCSNRYDLLLLDIMLPEINGYELLDYVRGIGDTPVIIISAMGQVDERIRGLRMGADDYICKPFQIGELLARVETVLRRTQRMAERLEIEDVAIDPKSRTVTKAGEQVELTVKEFDLLYELMKNKNVALSRRRLYELVWQEEYTGETRTLDSHVQRLRKKLDWNEKIVTVFRIGYRLEVRG